MMTSPRSKIRFLSVEGVSVASMHSGWFSDWVNREPKITLDLQTNGGKIMATLTVENVGPIRKAEFEVKKHTVFIGPQGSGKSTLAKLIAICSDAELLPNPLSTPESLPSKYNIESYFGDDTSIHYRNSFYWVNYKNLFDFHLTEFSQQILNKQIEEYRITNSTDEYLLNFLNYKQYIPQNREHIKRTGSIGNVGSTNLNFYSAFFKNYALKELGLYIPAERTLTAVLSNAIWSLVYSDVSLPKAITLFGRQFEEARNAQTQLDVPFLKVKYERKNGQDFIEYQPGKLISLAQSASGYQSIIPLLLVVEYQRQQSRRRFIIEEPELNLYPTAQKDLIYSLMGGLQPKLDEDDTDTGFPYKLPIIFKPTEYQDAEWVITTHSPYVLSSLNILMLAYKIAQRSDELRAEVEKIIPARCWINPDEFAAYYVDKGTVRSIISETTGLIDDNELDDVSDTLADEQNKLFALSRSIARV